MSQEKRSLNKMTSTSTPLELALLSNHLGIAERELRCDKGTVFHRNRIIGDVEFETHGNKNKIEIVVKYMPIIEVEKIFFNISNIKQH